MTATLTAHTFAETATAALQFTQRQVASKLAEISLTPAALVDFVENSADRFVEYATAADLYSEALSREADKPGRGPAWLSMKLGQLLNTGSRSSDKFYDATADAKRNAARQVLRDMRAYVDAAKVLEYAV